MTPSPQDLLDWYDRHRRDLPWRAKTEPPDPYKIWLSEIMLQQTTVAAVKPYFARFLDRFPTLEALAQAPSEEVMSAWAGLGYYSRARNLHACAKAVMERGSFPHTAAELRTLPGIGVYTAGAIAAIAFNQREAAIDGNVERVFSRLLALEEPLPKSRPLIREKVAALVPQNRPGDFAQALMDLGSQICTPRRPTCVLCPWRDPCKARALGAPETYPRKAPKPEKPLRRGAAFVACTKDGHILLRTRPPKGLLGGMSEVPCSEWHKDYDTTKAILDAPFEARWLRLNEPVRHVFTHFALELTVYKAKVTFEAMEGLRWVVASDLAKEPLPSLMRKVLKVAGV